MLPIHLALTPEVRRRQYLDNLPANIRAAVQARLTHRPPDQATALLTGEPWRPDALPPSELLRQAELAAPRPLQSIPARLDPNRTPYTDDAGSSSAAPQGTQIGAPGLGQAPFTPFSNAAGPHNDRTRLAAIQLAPVLYGVAGAGEAALSEYALAAALLAALGITLSSEREAKTPSDQPDKDRQGPLSSATGTNRADPLAEQRLKAFLAEPRIPNAAKLAILVPRALDVQIPAPDRGLAPMPSLFQAPNPFAAARHPGIAAPPPIAPPNPRVTVDLDDLQGPHIFPVVDDLPSGPPQLIPPEIEDTRIESFPAEPVKAIDWQPFPGFGPDDIDNLVEIFPDQSGNIDWPAILLSKKVRNPYGRRGGPEHQGQIEHETDFNIGLAERLGIPVEHTHGGSDTDGNPMPEELVKSKHPVPGAGPLKDATYPDYTVRFLETGRVLRGNVAKFRQRSGALISREDNSAVRMVYNSETGDVLVVSEQGYIDDVALAKLMIPIIRQLGGLPAFEDLEEYRIDTATYHIFRRPRDE